MLFKMVIKDLLTYKRVKDIISKNRLELDLIIDKKKVLESSSEVESKPETKAIVGATPTKKAKSSSKKTSKPKDKEEKEDKTKAKLKQTNI